jgi:hypothetical protein
MPEPVKGFDKHYDEAKLKLETCHVELKKYLTEVKGLLKAKRNQEIKYVHSKHLYEIEVP